MAGRKIVMYLRPDYKHDLYKSTAGFYSQYRIPYLKSLTDSLINYANIKDNDKLLDLACGPGRLTIPLAKYFREVFAIDLEEEMILEGKKIAADQKIDNIKWKTGKAEDFIFSPETFKLITIGDAFHRLDQLTVLEKSYRILKKGGCFAIIGCDSITNGNHIWQKELSRILSEWYKPDNGQINYPEQFIGALKEFGFKDVHSCSFEEKMELTIDEIIGFLRSMSIFSENAIGKDNEEFNRLIRTHLLKIKPHNKFEYDFSCGYHIGMKE